MRWLLVIVSVSLLYPAVSIAQQPTQNTGFMVHQLAVVPPENMEELNRIEALAAPVLNELRQDGMIRDWYSVRHAWGDEWNFGWITIAANHRAWLDFWDEFLRRFTERNPGEIDRLGSLFSLHKDNMYSVRDSSPPGP